MAKAKKTRGTIGPQGNPGAGRKDSKIAVPRKGAKKASMKRNNARIGKGGGGGGGG